MQTFLPYPDFAASARALDRARLGKQRVEARQLITALTTGSGWSNHPAARMWRGHEGALAEYGDAMIEEWIQRGYRNTMPLLTESGPKPHWFGDPAFHAAHRSNLLRKDPTHYAQFGWAEPPDLPYVWPVL